MPVNVVHSKRQEKMWEHAKTLAGQSGAKNKWALVMHIFQNQKKAGKVAHLDKSMSSDLVGEELVIARGHVLRRSVFESLLQVDHDPLAFLFKSEADTPEEWHSNHPDGVHELHAIANDYMKPRRLGQLRTAHLSGGWRTGNGLDPKVGTRIARAYEGAQHNPADPAVQNSYKAFRREVKAQADHLTAHGYKAEPWTGAGQPYKNAQEMSHDVRHNKHIYYFKSEQGSPTHKLLPNEDNDRFRWVHDVFGHAMGGNKFGPRPSHGETHAFLDHYQMFSPAARHALATETLGQNSWFNFSKHNEGRPIHEKEFAQQKATLLHPSLYEGLLKHTGLLKAFAQDDEYPEDYGYCPAHPRARHNPELSKAGGPRGMHVRPLGDSLRQQRDLEEKRYSTALRPRAPKLASTETVGKGKKPKLPALPQTLARSIVGFIRRVS